MLMRSGSFTRPSPLLEFDCGSQSTSSVLTSAAASEAARLMAVVVLPTPPFWLATAMTRPMIFLGVARQNMRTHRRKQCRILVQNVEVFHVKHYACSNGPAVCFTLNTSLAIGAGGVVSVLLQNGEVF